MIILLINSAINQVTNADVVHYIYHSTYPSYNEISTEAKMTGTIVPDQSSTTEKDCSDLKKAMKGFGTDEKKIIEILSNRTLQQRLDICFNYKVSHFLVKVILSG